MQTVTNCSFWVLLVIWGSGAGLFNALLTLLPQIVCPFGYSDVGPLTHTLSYHHTLSVCMLAIYHVQQLYSSILLRHKHCSKEKCGSV